MVCPPPSNFHRAHHAVPNTDIVIASNGVRASRKPTSYCHKFGASYDCGYRRLVWSLRGPYASSWAPRSSQKLFAKIPFQWAPNQLNEPGTN